LADDDSDFDSVLLLSLDEFDEPDEPESADLLALEASAPDFLA
jgi:hypothetical protein